MSKLKTLSPMTKLWFVVSLLALFLWVIPNMVSYYKSQKIYDQKVAEVSKLDKRESSFEAKPFHAEVFRVDAENYFDKVEVTSILNNSYRVTILFAKDNLPKFHAFLKDLSLNYRVSVEDNIIYEEVNKSMSVKMVVKPY